VEQLLYREARLLDERRYRDWLALWTDDASYWMPTRSNVAGSPRRPDVTVEEELADEDGVAWLQENKLTLLARVLRLGTGRAWAENPPSRTRHFVTNVELEATADPGEWRAYSNLLLYRSRRADAAHWFSCQRRDRLRQTPGGLLIAERRVVLDAHVLDSPNLSVFF
jgi:3-phenylpropionate/cinnamic acid dioxygenase small subunit